MGTIHYAVDDARREYFYLGKCWTIPSVAADELLAEAIGVPARGWSQDSIRACFAQWLEPDPKALTKATCDHAHIMADRLWAWMTKDVAFHSARAVLGIVFDRGHPTYPPVQVRTLSPSMVRFVRFIDDTNDLDEVGRMKRDGYVQGGSIYE
jgi:hypothetical protein